MLRNLCLALIILISATNAIFFGGGGGGSGCCCQQSCCCTPQIQSPCCTAPQPCCGGGYGGGGTQPYALPQQTNYAQPQQFYSQSQGNYASQYNQQLQPQAQPRYIIVRPVDSVSTPIGLSAAQNGPPPAPLSTNYQANPPLPEIPQAPPTPISQPESYKAAPYQSARASKTVLIDARCNSAELRQILEENIVADDANESKRRVHKAANEQFTNADDRTQGVDVICAPGAFSYRIATDFFCEHAKANITCFAYQQHATT